MRFDQLKYFHALASCQTIQAVSEQFFTSPQVVSNAIKQLEEELGVTLFIRTKKGLLLTETGNEIYPYIDEILENYQYLENNYINKIIAPQNLKILSCKGILFYFSKLIPFLNSNSSTQFNFTMNVTTVQEIYQTLYTQNNYNIIATVFGDPTLETIKKDPFIKKNYKLDIIRRDVLKVWINKNSPWAKKEKISYKQLKNFSFIRYNLDELSFDQYLKDNFHLKLQYSYQVSELPLALELAKKNQGCFFAPEYVIFNNFSAVQHKNIVPIDLDVEFYQNAVFLINNNNSLEDSFFASIMSLIKQN